jgi:hypothetical protein
VTGPAAAGFAAVRAPAGAWALRLAAAGWVAVRLAAPDGAAARPPAAGRLAFQAAAADRRLMARVLTAARVDRRPEPPGGSYLRDLWAELNRAVAELVRRATAPLHLPGDLAIAAVALLAIVAAALLARSWRLRRARAAAARLAAAAAAQAAGAGAADEAPAGGRGEAAWDAAAWRQELERCLAAGRAPQALRAAWWWLARTLAGEAADAAWTGGELLRRSGRQDLRDEVRRLDSLVYGVRPAANEAANEEVRRLAAVDEARGLVAVEAVRRLAAVDEVRRLVAALEVSLR